MRHAPDLDPPFGDWFFERQDGTVEHLDVLEGFVERLFADVAQFEQSLNDESWQEEYLLSWLVYDLHERGLVPGPGELYGFAPHPGISGKIDAEHAMVMPVAAWQLVCATTLIRDT